MDPLHFLLAEAFHHGQFLLAKFTCKNVGNTVVTFVGGKVGTPVSKSCVGSGVVGSEVVGLFVVTIG